MSRDARRQLSLILKKEKNWEEMLAADPADCFACEVLAKWYEHRQKNRDQALALVCSTLELITDRHADERERLHHRCLRLEKKCGKQ